MAGADFATRLARRALLWLLPVAAVWLLLTPLYNRVLVGEGAQLLRLTESPNATLLYLRDTHVLRIARLDIGGGQTALHETRLTDFHFDWILLAALFLATPGATPRERLRTLGWSSLGLAVFHLLLLLFYVKSVYANGLGDWSAQHYGAWGRNFWGLGKHILDLPVKFGLPFALWAYFHFAKLRPPPAAPLTQRKRKTSAASSA